MTILCITENLFVRHHVTASAHLRHHFLVALRHMNLHYVNIFNQIKSIQITLLAKVPLIRSIGAQVQGYNYNANTIPINNKSKKT